MIWFIRVTIQSLCVIAATGCAFGAEKRDQNANLFYDVDGLVESQADVSKMIDLLGAPKSEEVAELPEFCGVTVDSVAARGGTDSTPLRGQLA
jgi:hypothetical protein